MTVTPTESKIQKLVTACQGLLTKCSPTIADIAEVIELLVSNFPGAQYGPPHIRSLEPEKTQALKINKGNYKAHMQLTGSSIAELEWWIGNMPTRYCTPQSQHGYTNKCFRKGVRAALGNQEKGGRWTDAEVTKHINILELQAAFFATTLATLMYNYRLTTQRLCIHYQHGW